MASLRAEKPEAVTGKGVGGQKYRAGCGSPVGSARPARDVAFRKWILEVQQSLKGACLWPPAYGAHNVSAGFVPQIGGLQIIRLVVSTVVSVQAV